VAKLTARKQAARKAGSDRKLYTLDVSIMNGPMTESFLKKNKVVSRTIQIRGDQTLAELHRAIFDAFDREQEHMYEFQISGEGPMDPQAQRYVLPAGMHGGDKPAGGVKSTTIESLGLQVNDLFGYWFDFGDDWWHQIDVLAVEEKAARGKFPKVIKRVGKSPPQYVDWDEEEE
jgi:Plasmid pRiA4b ORF-3-like protein